MKKSYMKFGNSVASGMAFTSGIVFIIANLLIESSAQQTVSVSTSIGVINGKIEKITFLNKSSTLHKFLGVPFAEPPVGDLRFKKPVPKAPATSPLDATVHNSACMQGFQRPYKTYSEDCLYLNIYAPERKSQDEKLPVMVWIYGGAFTRGDSAMFQGDRLSIHGNVILVTLNYRVSIFGFLSTGDSVSPGNYGLWDQQLAIKWVHDNIAAFGGDTDKVTIFGQSAGSGSVIYQGLHTGNRGLFQRIIAESGSVPNWWASTDKGSQYATAMGSAANCKMDTSQALVSCLRNVSADKLIDLIANSSQEEIIPTYPFLPTVDNDFIKFDPKHVFDLENKLSRDAVTFFADFDLLTGVNAGEGVGGLSEMFGVADMIHFMPNRTDFKNRLVPLLVKVGYGDEHVPSVLSKMIAAEYTNWTDPDNALSIREEFVRMHGDFSFNIGMYKTLDTHSTVTSTKNTYMYYFDIEPETIIGSFRIPWFHLAMHGAELLPVFGYGIAYEKPSYSPTKWEMDLSIDIMTLWANFAKTGNPNSPDDMGLNWLSYNIKSQYYLHITRNLTSSNVQQRWNTRRAKFWLNLVPAILKPTTCGNPTI